MSKSLREEQSIFSFDVCRFILWAHELGYEVTFGEAQRPIEMQKIYYESGRSKTMDSLHIKRLAIDLFFFKDGLLLASKEEMQQIGNYWEAMCAQNTWGGNWKSFKDIPHFQRTVK